MRSILESRPAIEIAAWRLHARGGAYQAKVVHAQSTIRRALELAPDAYVATGMGKDSAVVAHLVHGINPAVPWRMLRFSESESIDTFADVLAAWKDRGVVVEIIDVARSDSWAITDAKSVMNRDQRGGVFLGLRKSESRARRMALTQYGEIHQYVGSGVWRIAPIAGWTTQDVAAYVVAHDLPMLSAYHRHGFEARTTAAIPVRNLDARSAALNRLRIDDPVRYAALCRMFPEVEGWM